ncbi:MAG: hypothetical protein NT129_02335 [Candidatus Aenigmarchaeota archaeon]|nr:hypothetical protein [Candidatus Aenigmarchaeota archaeon]
MTPQCERKAAEKYASPKFFDFLLDELGNPGGVIFYLHGEELYKMTERLLADHGIKIVTRDVFSILPSYLSLYENADFTPEKLKKIYRQQVKSKMVNHPVCDSDSDFVGLKEVAWLIKSSGNKPVSGLPYINFDGYSIVGNIGKGDKELFLKLKDKAIEYGVRNQIRHVS